MVPGNDLQKEFYLLDYVPNGACLIADDFTIVFWNWYLENYIGISREKILGANLLDKFPHLNSPKYLNRLHDVFIGGPPVIFSSQLHRFFFPVKKGANEYRIQHTVVAPLRISEKNKYFALITIEDVTELTHRINDYRNLRDKAFTEVEQRKKTEILLANEKERLSVTLKSIGDGIITTDVNLIITFLNESAEQITEWKTGDVTSKHLSEIFTLFDQDNGTPITYKHSQLLTNEYEDFCPEFSILRSKTGNEAYIHSKISPIKNIDGNTIGYVIVIRDMSHTKKLSDDLQKAKTLETMGILAGGLAHNFNNLLTTILGYADLLRFSLTNQEKELRKLDAIERAGFRAKDLAQRLITFAEGGSPFREMLSVNYLITNLTDLLYDELKIICETHLPSDSVYAKFDENQIKTALKELVINAHESMLKLNDKTVNIYLSVINAENENNLSVKHGRYIKISIIDHGIGIPEMHINKIFDPFYTTQPDKRGLGLTIAYSIAKKHNGFIYVQSVEGEGSAFDFYLPADK